ncbi:MAG: hypothetical protein WB592_00405 [Acidimicrobiales bacterium]
MPKLGHPGVAESFDGSADLLSVDDPPMGALRRYELHIHGGFWHFVADFNINKAGVAIVGLFVFVWSIALVYWRMGRVETRWSGPRETGTEPALAATDSD